MEHTIRILTIGLYTLISVLFAQLTLAATEATTPEIDRNSPEHVEHATFAMG